MEEIIDEEDDYDDSRTDPEDDITIEELYNMIMEVKKNLGAIHYQLQEQINHLGSAGPYTNEQINNLNDAIATITMEE